MKSALKVNPLMHHLDRRYSPVWPKLPSEINFIYFNKIPTYHKENNYIRKHYISTFVTQEKNKNKNKNEIINQQT